jgi:hypothetical protein
VLTCVLVCCYSTMYNEQKIYDWFVETRFVRACLQHVRSRPFEYELNWTCTTIREQQKHRMFSIERTSWTYKTYAKNSCYTIVHDVRNMQLDSVLFNAQDITLSSRIHVHSNEKTLKSIAIEFTWLSTWNICAKTFASFVRRFNSHTRIIYFVENCIELEWYHQWNHVYYQWWIDAILVNRVVTLHRDYDNNHHAICESTMFI